MRARLEEMEARLEMREREGEREREDARAREQLVRSAIGTCPDVQRSPVA